MHDMEGRRERFRQRFRRSGSLGIPFIPEDEIPNIKEYFSFDKEVWQDGGELLSLIVPLPGRSGSVSQIFAAIEEQGLEVHHFESRKSKDNGNRLDILIQCRLGQQPREKVVSDMARRGYSVEESEQHREIMVKHAEMNGIVDDGLEDLEKILKTVPWFPRTAKDMDIAGKRVLMYGSELDADHPGFKDAKYRERRMQFAQIANEYEQGKPIPFVEYNEQEKKTWRTVYTHLRELHQKYACKEYLSNFELLEKYAGYGPHQIPQLQDVSTFLKAKTGFQLRPVAGYLSSRDFLAALAFRIFCCTQYIRHPDDPFYSPEPDCCHELMGHMPLFADPDFAQFSQEIGLASLGASESEISKLATLYFFSVEFGLCRQDEQVKVYGAGLLSSIGELKDGSNEIGSCMKLFVATIQLLQHVAEGTPEVHNFDPDQVVKQECLITTYQDAYFLTNDFEEMLHKMRMFATNMKRPFVLRYNPYTESIEILSHKRTMMAAVNSLRSDFNLLATAMHKV